MAKSQIEKIIMTKEDSGGWTADITWKDGETTAGYSSTWSHGPRKPSKQEAINLAIAAK